MYKDMFYTEDLNNVVEEMVFMNLKNIIDEGTMSFCNCTICLQDIAAIVLNKIPPLYKTNFVDKLSPTDKEREKLEHLNVIIKEELINAIEKVKMAPHH